MTVLAIAVDPDEPTPRAAAVVLSARLNLPVVPIGQPGVDVFLVATGWRIELRAAGPGRCGAVYVDFLAGPMRRRLKEVSSSRQMIARAVGYKGQPLSVVDATAGLGRDAFLLACLGCTVTAIERNPAIAALLADGLRRVASDPQIEPVLRGRLRLVEADARTFLAGLADGDRPDVVCLDPMFPHRAKSALARKEMRLCRLVAGDDADADELLEAARAVARLRVVVKRRRHAPVLGGDPAFSYRGRTVRYDVYPCAGATIPTGSG